MTGMLSDAGESATAPYETAEGIVARDREPLDAPMLIITGMSLSLIHISEPTRPY